MPSVSYSLRRAIAALALLALNACATKDIDPGYTLDETSGKGVVIGSITYSGIYSSYSVYYRRVGGGGGGGHFQFGHSDFLFSALTKDDIRAPGVRGDVFAVELPAGGYEIYRWYVGSGSASIVPVVPFSVRFTVEPGKSVYLGNFHFRRNARLGLAVVGVTVNYKNESDRDLAIFATKYPALANVEIGSSIEKGQSYDNLGEASYTTITIPILIYR